MDESAAFPSGLRDKARAIAASVSEGEMHPPRYALTVRVDGEALHIPYRLYYKPALLRHGLMRSQGTDRLVLACLGSRHYDGYLRQECLGVLFTCGDSWLTPYFLQLAGEYVVEIVDEVCKGIVSRDIAGLARFTKENPDYLATLARRVRRHWNCYHRHAYPQQHAYPGTRVIAYLEQSLKDQIG